MIKLSRINKREFYLNAEMVEQVEATPDTVITLMNGKTIMVINSVKEVVKKIVRYRRMLLNRYYPKKGEKKKGGLKASA